MKKEELHNLKTLKQPIISQYWYRIKLFFIYSIVFMYTNFLWTMHIVLTNEGYNLYNIRYPFLFTKVLKYMSPITELIFHSQHSKHLCYLLVLLGNSICFCKTWICWSSTFFSSNKSSTDCCALIKHLRNAWKHKVMI